MERPDLEEKNAELVIKVAEGKRTLIDMENNLFNGCIINLDGGIGSKLHDRN